MGKNIRRVLETLDRLGEDLQRPPTRPELQAALPDLHKARVSDALSALVRGGYIEEVTRGVHVQVKTAEGKRVVWSRRIE